MMNSIVSSPLLLENEALRECLRAREAEGLVPARGLRVPAVVKPAALALLATTLTAPPLSASASPAVEWSAAAWPAAIRQLHWELSSSTTLRPLANLMGKAALLPDPWSRQGGLRTCGQPLSPVLRQHADTRLYTILRVDVLLSGALQVATVDVAAEMAAGEPAESWSLAAGDILILNADVPVTEQLSGDACVWTAYYYSPDPCCCKAQAMATAREGRA